LIILTYWQDKSGFEVVYFFDYLNIFKVENNRQIENRKHHGKLDRQEAEIITKEFGRFLAECWLVNSVTG
jgi:hypothetical protein